jgi:hypothetical protein
MSSLKNHPARLAAIAAGTTTFSTDDVPCQRCAGVSRNTKWLFCCACDRERTRKWTRKRATREAARLAKVREDETKTFALIEETLRANWRAYAEKYPNATNIPERFK